MKTDEEWLAEWNKEYCASTALHRDRMTKWLETHMLEAKDAYYNSGEAIMSDESYDRFEWYLRIREPNHTLLDNVGSE